MASDRLVNKYRMYELRNEALGHAVDAQYAAMQMPDISFHIDHTTGEAKQTSSNEELYRAIRRIHSSATECIKSFAAFSQECGVPFGAYSRDGDHDMVSIVKEMITEPLRAATVDGIWKNTKCHISEAYNDSLLTNTVFRQEPMSELQMQQRDDQEEARKRVRKEHEDTWRQKIPEILKPVSKEIEDIELINNYMLGMRGKDEQLQAIKERFLGKGMAK